MLTIWKFPLEHHNGDFSLVEMPKDAEILSAGFQGDALAGKFMVWAKVDDNKPRVKRGFTVHGTGHDADDTIGSKFVGTVFIGPLVFHVFDLGEASH